VASLRRRGRACGCQVREPKQQKVAYVELSKSAIGMPWQEEKAGAMNKYANDRVL
jgi:hypothetical protein